jgi:hypothetical protein
MRVFNYLFRRFIPCFKRVLGNHSLSKIKLQTKLFIERIYLQVILIATPQQLDNWLLLRHFLYLKKIYDTCFFC